MGYIIRCAYENTLNKSTGYGNDKTICTYNVLKIIILPLDNIGYIY
jgi:hypothetical protein